jgi:predicted N-acetyltransferase YhbS
VSVDIRMATERDNESLLALTRLAPMDGRIALRIDRGPDFFALLRHRGEAAVFVAVRDGDVIACISAALQTVYVGGVPERVAYVGDLKVHPHHAGTRAVVRLIAALREHIEERGVDLVWSVVAAGNERVMPLLSGRMGIAPFVFAGRFVVDELLGTRSARRTRYEVAEAADGDRAAIDALLERFRRARELAPPRSPSDDAIGTLVARESGRVVATLELFDPTRIKRNVLLGAPLLTRAALRMLRPLVAMPRVGDAVRLAYIRHFACEDGRDDALAALVQHARAIARRRGFSFAAIGLHERDPLRRVVRGIPRFSFSSHAFVASLRGSTLVNAVVAGVPFEDFALV